MCLTQAGSLKLCLFTSSVGPGTHSETVPPLELILHHIFHQFSSVAQSCPTLCDPMNHSMPGLPVHHQSVMPSSHLILCRPLFLLPPIPPSIRVFSNESTLRMRWPKYWSFSFSISPFKEIPGLISFRMDLLDLLAVQGTLKSLLQHHSSKASILRGSAFFTVQLTSIHDHRKNHSLD